MGTCLPVYGKKQGEHCSRDTDCDSGFLCIDSGYGRSCQTPVPGDKGLGKFFFFFKKRFLHSTVWKLLNFSVAQILREIKDGISRGSKSIIVSHLEFLNSNCEIL